MSSKNQKRQRPNAFIFVNTIQYQRTQNNNIYHSNKQEPPRFFQSDTNTWPRSGLFSCQNPCSGSNNGTDLVTVPEYIYFFQLCSKTEQISQVHKIPKKLCKSHYCRSNQPLSKLQCFFALFFRLFNVAMFLLLQLFVPNDIALTEPIFVEHKC